MAILGLLSREFPSASLEAHLDVIAATGTASVQFDLESAVGHTFPLELSEAAAQTVKGGFLNRQLFRARII
jgi:hypothetical protein